MNSVITKLLEDETVIENGLTYKQKEEFRLYYVAASRCKHKLYNAMHIEKYEGVKQ